LRSLELIRRPNYDEVDGPVPVAVAQAPDEGGRRGQVAQVAFVDHE
jgi:hypothetical protein